MHDGLTPSPLMVRLTALALIARAVYAVVLAFAGWSVWLDLGLVSTPVNFEEIIQTANAPRMVFWAIYATGYLVAGFLLLLRSRLTLWVFAVAFTIDLLLWILSATHPLYDQIFLGWATQIDAFFNIIDFVFLAAIAWFHYRGVFKRPA